MSLIATDTRSDDFVKAFPPAKPVINGILVLIDVCIVVVPFRVRFLHRYLTGGKGCERGLRNTPRPLLALG